MTRWLNRQLSHFIFFFLTRIYSVCLSQAHNNNYIKYLLLIHHCNISILYKLIYIQVKSCLKQIVKKKKMNKYLDMIQKKNLLHMTISFLRNASSNGTMHKKTFKTFQSLRLHNSISYIHSHINTHMQCVIFFILKFV